ncbi:hypothetical protein [Methanothrix soehngenii]|nr:hypothetical protein [Methanothrix soehngenii]HNQ53739.1 hypothetical protein [Methanothrix soehngenii]
MVMVTCPKCKKQFEMTNFPHPDHVKPWCEECLNKYLYDKKA